MKTNFELVKEFHAAFNKVPDPEVPIVPDDKILILRSELIKEEFREYNEEAGLDNEDNGLCFSAYYTPHLASREEFRKQIDLSKVAKELADLLYVVYGTAAAYGIPIDDVYREVHRSNMSKLGEDGKPIYREDGKVLKGPNYSPADVEKVLRKARMW